MNTIMKRISEIEDAASDIRKGAEEKKQQRAEMMAQKTKDFDERSAKETAQAIARIREEQNAGNQEALRQQREQTQNIIANMELQFEEEHTRLAETIFRGLIR